MAFSHSLGPDCFCSGRQLQEGLRKLLERSVMPAVRTLPMAAFSATRRRSRSVPKTASLRGQAVETTVGHHSPSCDGFRMAAP